MTQALKWACRTFAIGTLLTAFVAVPQVPDPAQQIAEAIRTGRTEDAVALAEEWIVSSPRDPRPWTLKGLAVASLGRSEDALQAYRSALSRHSDYLPALLGAAEIELRSGLPEARERLERVVRLQPANATAHAMLGILAYAVQDCDLALEHFRRGAEVVATDAVALAQRAECFFAAGQFESAAEDYRQLLGDSTRSPELSHNLGLALFEAGRAEEAAEVLLPVVTSGPSPDIETLSLLAEAQHEALDTAGALATLQRAVRSHPKSERLYLQLAELCIEHGAYDLGVEIVDIGARNIPGSFRIPTMRGILLAELGLYDEAEAMLQAAASSGSDTQSAAVGLSLTLQKTGRMEESIEVLRDRVDESPDDAVANFFFAQALIKQGVQPGSSEFRQAREGLMLASDQLPREASPLIELGKLYLMAKQPERAINFLERAARLAPSDRQAVYNLMIAYRRVGRSEDAAVLAVKVRERLNDSKREEIRRNRLRIIRTEDGP